MQCKFYTCLRAVLLTILLYSFPTAGYSQVPNILWQQSLGGTENDYAYCIREVAGGGYIVAGSSNSLVAEMPGQHGGYDAYIVRMDASGVVAWQRLLGGTADDYAYSVRQTNDGGFVVAGATRSIDGDVVGGHGDFDFRVVKLSGSGSISWQVVLGGSGADNAYDVQQTTDTGYIVVGRSASTDGDVTVNHGGYDYWVVKLSSSGTMQWQRSFGGSNDDNAASVQQAADGGYIVAGDSYSADGDITASKGGEDYWIVKLNASGSMEWQRSLGGSGSEYAQSVRQTGDNGYIVAGGSNSTNGEVTGNIGGGDFWIVKLSPTGSIVWQKSVGSMMDDAANSVEVTADGGYIVAGWATANNGNVTGFHGSADYWLVKLSPAGSLEWQKCLGSLGNENGWCAQPTSDGSYIMAGFTFYQGGDVTSNHGKSDSWIVKLHNATNTEGPGQTEIKISPNPATGMVSICGADHLRVKICNTTGMVVSDTINCRSFSVAELPPGLYFVAVYDADGLLLKQDKLVKL